MNWITAAQMVLRKLSQPQSELPKVKIALREAMDILRKDDLEFLDGSFSLYLTADKNEYGPGEGQSASPEHRGLPHGLLSIDERLRYVASGNSEADYTWIDRVGPDQFMDILRSDGGDFETGPPRAYIWQDSKLKLAPVPDTTGAELYGRGSMDSGVPILYWDGSSLTPYTPDGTKAVPNDWTSGWLSQALDVTVSKTCAIYAEQYLQDRERAAEALAQLKDHRESLVARRNKKQGLWRRRLYL